MIISLFVTGESGSRYSETEWHIESVQRVANEIKKHCTEHDISTPDSVSLLDVSSKMFLFINLMFVTF